MKGVNTSVWGRTRGSNGSWHSKVSMKAWKPTVLTTPTASYKPRAGLDGRDGSVAKSIHCLGGDKGSVPSTEVRALTMTWNSSSSLAFIGKCTS